MLSVSRGIALEQYPCFQVHTPRIGTVALEVSGVAELSPYTAAESSKNSAQDIKIVQASQARLHFFELQSHFLARWFRIDRAGSSSLETLADEPLEGGTLALRTPDIGQGTRD